MKLHITILLILSSFTLFAQRFDVVGSVYDGANVAAVGEVFVNLANKSIEIDVNGRKMSIQKMTFKKGGEGELMCYKESIEAKQRIVFSPNKDKKGEMLMVSHIMTYTVVRGFSRNRDEVVYHLIKKR